MTRKKQNSTTMLVYENDEYKFKKWTRIKEFDTILREWVKTSEEVTFESLESHGLSKKPITVSAIFIRTRESRLLMEGTEIDYFLAKFRFEIPNVKANKHTYLSFVEETNTVHRHVLNANVSHIIDWNDSTYCTLISEPKPISKEEVSKLLKEKKVFPKFLIKSSGMISEIVHFRFVKA